MKILKLVGLIIFIVAILLVIGITVVWYNISTPNSDYDSNANHSNTINKCNQGKYPNKICDQFKAKLIPINECI
jgi:predicted permease